MTDNNLDMRSAYVDCLRQLGAEYPKLVVLDSDLASSTGTQKFGELYPERFFDCGIQEANMVGVAAGMATEGMLPIAHTFAAFAGRRIVDQVFLSCVYAQSNVRIVGVDPGICASKNGGTHMALEDVGIMRTLPNMIIFEPSDVISMQKLLRQSVEQTGVYYIRINRKATYRVYDETAEIRIGKANTVVEGNDITLIAQGTVCVPEAIRATKVLQSQGISARVLDMATVKPLDISAVQKAARETRAMITIENHNIINGLGSAVAEVLAESGTVPFARIGAPDVVGQVGTLEDLQKLFGLTAEAIVKKAIELLGK